MAYKKFTGKRKRDGQSWSMAKKFRKGLRRNRRRRRGRAYTKLLRQPVPDKIMTKLKYTEAISFGSLVGLVLSNYQFRNSIFDPNVTSSGHQPLWRDQLANLYSRYRVHGIKYKFTIWNQNQPGGLFGGVKHSNDGVVETVYTTLRERRGVQTFTVAPPGAQQKIVKGYMPVGKPHGLSKREFMWDEDFEADIGTNPVKQTYLEIYLTTQGPTAIANVIADLVYYVELNKRVNVGSS